MRRRWRRKEIPSFLKKRSKKLLPNGARLAGSARKGLKFFGSFFQKSTSFFLRIDLSPP
jgi:hypothetical protein